MQLTTPDLSFSNSPKALSRSIIKRRCCTLAIVDRQALAKGPILSVIHCRLHYAGFVAPDGDTVGVHNTVPCDATRRVVSTKSEKKMAKYRSPWHSVQDWSEIGQWKTRFANEERPVS